MLLEFYINNFGSFNEPVTFNMQADMRTKKFTSNVFTAERCKPVKTAVIYGPNNTGKTWLVRAIEAYVEVIMKKSRVFNHNVFSSSSVVQLGAKFTDGPEVYGYYFDYDVATSTFVKERFVRYLNDNVTNPKYEPVFIRDILNPENNYAEDKELKQAISIASGENILIYALNVEMFASLHHVRDILVKFAESFTILYPDEQMSFNNVLYNQVHTIEIMRGDDERKKRLIEGLIVGADVDIEGFRFDEESPIVDQLMEQLKDKKVDISNTQKALDTLKLVSVHKGKAMPSMFIDSIGTKKISSLAGYIADKIYDGGCLIIDELDSSIHFKITRAIVALFNSLLNYNAQLICTTHDVSLLDVQRLLRKEQIWFTDKTSERVDLYSLSSFTSRNKGVRLESNLYNIYSKGLLGALPEPDLITALIEAGEVDD